MLAPPNGLTDEDVAVALLGGWSLAPESLTYAPVGFGSHHWIAGDHFVTVDDLADASGLEAALRTARALRDDADLPFVIAATPAADGALLVPVGGGWVMHVYERLDVVDDTTFGPHDDSEGAGSRVVFSTTIRGSARTARSPPRIARSRSDSSSWDVSWRLPSGRCETVVTGWRGGWIACPIPQVAAEKSR